MERGVVAPANVRAIKLMVIAAAG